MLPIIRKGYRREGNKWYRIDGGGNKRYLLNPNARVTLLDRADTIRLKDGTTAKYYKDSLGQTHVFFNNGREMIRNSSGDRFMRNYSIDEDGNFTSSEIDKRMFNSPSKKVVTTPTSTTRVGGFKINDGVLSGSGLFIDKAPEVDTLRPIENSDTDSVAFKQPTRQFIQQPSTLNISTPTEGLNIQKVYNKKDTRSWLWSQGIDPYTLTGRQRRKIRNDLNSTGTTNFKINGMSIAKKGSKLIKKEEVCPKCGKVHKAGIGCTVAKFKYNNGGNLNGIPFMQKGKDLPTAPKAEKRFRKNSYNTTKKGNRETTTITSQTFGYNRNWPYFIQPATIQRIIEGGDTAFVEIPEHHTFTKVQPRTALKSGNVYVEYNPKYDKTYSLHGQANTVFNYPVTSQEYEILKRRFNTAWNLK